MILAFKISDIITVPFGYLMGLLYQLTNNYGFAMIIFALIVQLVLMPINAKSKKSMMKMSRLTPMMEDIKRRYSDDPNKQNQLIQQLYQDEGVSMTGGCLWSLIPMFILFPLFTVIRQPMTYILMESQEAVETIISIIKTGAPELFSSNNYYDQVVAAQAIPQFAAQIKEAIPTISATTLEGINFDFFGINLGAIPQFNIFASTWQWNWAHIGAFLIPCLSAGSQVLSMWVSQRSNNSVVTNKDGIQDKEAAKNSQQNQSNQMMMWMMPLMSLWIGFTVSAGLSLYWFVGGVVRMISDFFMTKHYRKIYDAEDAERLKRYMERQKAEEEKERIRAERRAANPDGQTQNTSKKKLQQKQKAESEAAKLAAAKEYASKKGIVWEEEETKQVMSGIPERPYCKGRNYDPNRYSTTTEE